MNGRDFQPIIFTDSRGDVHLYGSNTFEHRSEHVTLESALYRTCDGIEVTEHTFTGEAA